MSLVPDTLVDQLLIKRSILAAQCGHQFEYQYHPAQNSMVGIGIKLCFDIVTHCNELHMPLIENNPASTFFVNTR